MYCVTEFTEKNKLKKESYRKREIESRGYLAL